jgi:aminopeptidase 2
MASLVEPLHYELELQPGFESFEFMGSVSVTLRVRQSSQRITAHAFQLTISNAYIEQNGNRLDSISTTFDPEYQTVTFEFASEIQEGYCVLKSEFTGIHNDQMAGFYRSGYTDKEGNKKFMMVTQFCATDARRCFPCWDEPALKATFDVTLYVPQDKTALCNMNVSKEEIVDRQGSRLKAVHFARTPKMSTYLLCMVVGEFDYMEAWAHPKSPADAKEIQCRVYTLPGQKELGRYALGISTRTLEYFSEYFDVAYPLPKLDMVAIPDFGVGAMENWGLVTYREQALLFDAEKSSAKAREKVGYTVCHEISHQWFGNLVSPKWWSDIWLNEGFATIVGWQAIDEFYKEWDVFTSFVIGNYAAGINLDSMRSSHPVEVQANTPAEIAQIFDAISYSKGASVIRMLNDYLGKELFAKGIRKYLKKHLYSNATTSDLWESLSEVSGQDIGTMMAGWIEKVGFPVVRVEKEEFNPTTGQMTLQLSQERFLSSGDLSDQERNESSIWQIPVSVVTNQGEYKFLFKEQSGTIRFPYVPSKSSFWKLNGNSNGFFRVLLQPNQLEEIGRTLLDHPDPLSQADRIGLISDAFALAKAGLCNTTEALSLLQCYNQESSQM